VGELPPDHVTYTATPVTYEDGTEPPSTVAIRGGRLDINQRLNKSVDKRSPGGSCLGG
jgi:hypothetical protein